MAMLEHLNLMASYNERMNVQVFASASELTKDDLNQDRGAFFSSILGTLNHILVGDLIWLRRFATHGNYSSLEALLDFPTPSALSHCLFDDLEALHLVRARLDEIISRWLVDDMVEGDLNRTLKYSDTKGVASERQFYELICHFFNHQTHHRGQVSTLLSQCGVDIGVTDFLIDIPDRLARA